MPVTMSTVRVLQSVSLCALVSPAAPDRKLVSWPVRRGLGLFQVDEINQTGGRGLDGC